MPTTFEPETATDPTLRPAGVSAAALAAAVPDFALAGTFLVAWIAPSSLPASAGQWLTLTMLLEFIVVHSSGFAGTVLVSDGDRAKKSMALLGITAFYLLFVVGFGLAFHAWWPVGSFLVLTLNRLLSILFRQPPRGEEKAFVMRGWAASGVFYLLACFLTVVPPLPRLGVDAAAQARWRLPGSGLWIDQPWRVMAFGTLYFTLTAVSELYSHRWAARGIPGAARTRAR